MNVLLIFDKLFMLLLRKNTKNSLLHEKLKTKSFKETFLYIAEARLLYIEDALTA